MTSRETLAKGEKRAWPCEHAFVMYADALLLLFELADREDERFQLAPPAAEDHARPTFRCARLLSAIGD
jgi:hypothetical protein